jgi:hypothetical protein
LGEGQCLAIKPFDLLKRDPHPLIQDYFKESSS